MKILITGGAGYIGGFMTKRLLDEKFEVMVIDSLERGYKEKVDQRASFYQGNVLDKAFVKDIFNKEKFDAVIHFAAFIAVGESMQNPGKYFENNFLGTLNILEEMKNHSVNNFIFSSTGTVYGTPIKIPLSEDHQKNPENPYSESKYMVEKLLLWYKKIYNINHAVLRYFNAAGGAIDGSMGEDHDPETHLIPNAIKAALDNSEFTLFGNDYNTPDGTCIRDYIHVLDLVESHLISLDKLLNEKKSYVLNVGTGQGHTNYEVISMVKKISGVDFPIVIKGRREGDVEITVADVTKIKEEFNFTPKYSDLETIVKTAWQWHLKNSKL